MPGLLLEALEGGLLGHDVEVPESDVGPERGQDVEAGDRAGVPARTRPDLDERGQPPDGLVVADQREGVEHPALLGRVSGRLPPPEQRPAEVGQTAGVTRLLDLGEAVVGFGEPGEGQHREQVTHRFRRERPGAVRAGGPASGWTGRPTRAAPGSWRERGGGSASSSPAIAASAAGPYPAAALATASR